MWGFSECDHYIGRGAAVRYLFNQSFATWHRFSNNEGIIRVRILRMFEVCQFEKANVEAH